MNLYADLEWRGLVRQVTDPELPALLEREKMTLYCGFDPTADSLHLGSLLPLLVLRRFQDAGHRVIAVVGGATGRVGDPSFKAQERKLMDDAQLATNLAGIRGVIERFLDFGGSNPAKLLNNYDWFRGVEYLDFLRDVGKHFTINHMIAKESVRARLEDRDHGISYTEFSYMLLQAYDFHHLFRTEGCRLQIGGSDQWGNITAGTELIRRMAAADEREAVTTYGLTFPLVMKADGTKFGKSETGTVWLSAEKTSPYALYQFLLQTQDADVMGQLKFFTFLAHEEIDAIEREHRASPEKRTAQRRLAQELTRFVHGAEELQKAEASASALFTKKLTDLTPAEILSAFETAPRTEITYADYETLIALPGPLVDLLVRTGLAPSKGQARKDIQGGGISLNDERIDDPARALGLPDLIGGSLLVLRKGKKTYHLVKLT